ncbi:protein O-mannosyl-transferase Tmtc3 [Trichonephila inaurata madagascariensis]|uniref:dolichyl-phosphate-mannose--protein mannosyltransferase n=1 Tax=Trichonephila inaurata madagascariensis TaxID=2747483 RepID=A0A8X6X2C7_9ARAC|nr:protein O-mannosyl-transferase Tmtc3 [Trichonephila inaurata madagascariensis]
MYLGKRLSHFAAVIAVSFICYYNALHCGFVFDDISAIRDNKDLRPSTPLLNIFFNDFWGTPIHKEHSHKSYRPLCVLTFRINYALHQLNPWGYHLFNIILHVLVCVLYLRMCQLFLPATASFIAALLFAVHPIHTEAVTGIVGRAEILSSIFFLLAFLSYIKCSKSYLNTDRLQLCLCLFFIICATLSKEQGITVAGVCFLYELFIVQKLRFSDVLQILQVFSTTKSSPSPWLRNMIVRLIVITGTAVCLLIARVKIMGAQLPVFTKFDNPAAASAFPVRQLTYNYLLPVNAWLLLFPSDLCCDWTMGTIPLVESIFDPRNVATLTFYCVLGAVVWVALKADTKHFQLLSVSLSLLVLPFLPASNLFFPVGFVVAERILYIPSMGFCLLVAYGWNLLYKKLGKKGTVVMLISVVIMFHSLKTVLRNNDWVSEKEIFAAGLKVNKRNAKLYNNVGHALESRGQFKEALEYFLQAAVVQTDDIGAHMNVGRTYNNLKMYNEAEAAFWKAKNLLPRARPGKAYQARIAPSHLNVFLNLANLISRNGTRLEEADALYRQAIGMRADYIQAYINRGDILIKLNRTTEAQEVYEKALQLDNKNPDIYYNLGVVYLEQSKLSDALTYFDKALELDPEHEQALMNSAILIQESGNLQKRKTAYDRLYKLLKKGKTNERIYFNLGMLAMDDKEVQLAEKWFKKAIEIFLNPFLFDEEISGLFNLALLLSDDHRPLEAVPFLKQLLKHYPEHIKGLILLGDVYINHLKDLDAAQKCYEKILGLDPTNIQAIHNLCVVYVERGLLQYAEACLLKAVSLAPKEEYLLRHLAIVQARIRKQKSEDESMSTKSSDFSQVQPSPSSMTKVFQSTVQQVSSIPSSSIELSHNIVYSESPSVQTSSEVQLPIDNVTIER